MNTLEFDLEKLKNTKQKCEDLATEISELKTELLEELDGLRKDWNTLAGKTFFEEQDTDWTAQVDNYVKITSAISELLGVAITGYEGLVEEARAIKL